MSIIHSRSDRLKRDFIFNWFMVNKLLIWKIYNISTPCFSSWTYWTNKGKSSLTSLVVCFMLGNVYCNPRTYWRWYTGGSGIWIGGGGGGSSFSSIVYFIFASAFSSVKASRYKMLSLCSLMTTLSLGFIENCFTSFSIDSNLIWNSIVPIFSIKAYE